MNKDLKYLSLCVEGARLFSTCDKGQYMALITDTQGHVVGFGYNGSPKGMSHCNDGACPRAQTDKYIRTSSYENCIAIHAEANCLLHSDYTARSNGGTLYVNGQPCFSCAKLAANSGITRIVYLQESKKIDNWTDIQIYLAQAGINLERYNVEDLIQ